MLLIKSTVPTVPLLVSMYSVFQVVVEFLVRIGWNKVSRIHNLASLMKS
jgi:hypothetical protein